MPTRTTRRHPKGRLLSAYLHAIGTAVPEHDIHARLHRLGARRGWPIRARRAAVRPDGRRARASRTAGRCCRPAPTADRRSGPAASTPAIRCPAPAARMAALCRSRARIWRWRRSSARRAGRARRHHAISSSRAAPASSRPGIDQIIAARLGLAPSVERLLIGFMGCYAAVAALRSARHIVRSEPDARVLVVTVELSTLHLQPDDRDRAAAGDAPVRRRRGGGAGHRRAAAASRSAQPFAATLPDSADADPLGHRRHGLRDAPVGRGAGADRARRWPIPAFAARGDRRRDAARSTAGRSMPAGARSSMRSSTRWRSIRRGARRLARGAGARTATCRRRR